MELPISPGISGNFRSIASFVNRWFPTPRFIQPATVGVDISDVSVKWVVLDTLKYPRVRSFGVIPLESGIVVGGVIKDRNALTHALKALSQYGITEAHAALPEEAAYVFTLSVPADSTREQILRMIEFEFEGRIPISPEASVYDFDVIPESRSNGMRELGVVVFPLELAEAYASAFNDTGVRLLSLELEARSIARAASSKNNPHKESTALLVDFGKLRSGIAVLKNGIPILTSTIEVGGDIISHGLVETLHYTEMEAETFRNEHGLLADPKNNRQALEIATTTASALTDEINRYYHFWGTRKNEHGERVVPISRIILVGGSANLRGLEEYVSARVQVTTERADVWRNAFSYDEYIPPISRHMSLGYATSIGLALRGL